MADNRRMADEPIEETEETAVGDGRLKHVTVTTRKGAHIDHGETYLKHADSAFIVSSESGFPDDDTTRYAKNELRRVEITQHHSMCFITTAVADDDATLSPLREFRDATLSATLPGRALVSLYESVSPPIAHTLSRHPDAHMTRFVRWLVVQCAGLARQHVASDTPGIRTVYSILLLVLYVFGVACAACGHLSIRCSEIVKPQYRKRDSIRDRKSAVGSRQD
jgi:hypothetical protein